MPQRNWDSLSVPYRSRLLRSGITPEQYASGAKLTAARGHAKTPERPERAFKNPAAYPEYVEKRAPVTGVGIPTEAVVYEHVKTILLNEFAADRLEKLDVSTMKEMIHNADPATRLRMLSMNGEQYRAQASIQQPWAKKTPNRPWFVNVNGHWLNPFWYH